MQPRVPRRRREQSRSRRPTPSLERIAPRRDERRLIGEAVKPSTQEECRTPANRVGGGLHEWGRSPHLEDVLHSSVDIPKSQVTLKTVVTVCLGVVLVAGGIYVLLHGVVALTLLFVA